MSFHKNPRYAAPKRGGYKNVTREFSSSGFRKPFYSNGYNDRNKDDEPIDSDNDQDDKIFSNERNKSSNLYYDLIQTDLKTITKTIRQFQNGEKKSWPKYIRNITNLFLTSDSFCLTLEQHPERAYEDVTRFLSKIYLSKLFPDIIEELILCVTALSKSLNSLHRNLFNWLFSLYFNNSATNVDETRSVVLKTLHNVVKQSANGVYENLFYAQKKLKQALEDANSVEMVIRISKLMIFIGEKSPNSFQFHIKDFVDILLGWFLDSRQPEIAVLPLENLIHSIDLYLKKDFQFSSLLLEQFLEDFQKYYKEILAEDDKIKFQCNLHKMALLIRVYVLFFQKLDFNNTSINGGSRIGNNFDSMYFENVITLLMEVVISLKLFVDYNFYEELVSECNLCISVLFIAANSNVKWNVKPALLRFKENFFSYCEILFTLIPNSSQKLMITSLDLMKIFSSHYDTNLPIDFVLKLFSPKFQLLKFFMINLVQQSYFELMYSILRIKSVEILEISYQHILKQLKCAFEALSEFKNIQMKKMSTVLPKDNKLLISQELFSSEQKCLISIQSDLVLLAEIANTKNSLIAMWALVPNIMDAMIHDLIPTYKWLSEHYASIYYSLLYIFYSYCKKNDHFIYQSSHFSSVSNQVVPSFDDDNILTKVTKEKDPISSSFSVHLLKLPDNASQYFVHTLKTIKSILKMGSLNSNTILLCLHWVEQIVTFFKANNIKQNVMVNLGDFASLIDIVSEYSFSNNFDICKSSCKIIQDLLPLNDCLLAVYSSVISNYQKACEFNISHTNKDISDLYLNLFAILPSNSRAINIVSSKIITRVYSIQNENFLYPEEAHLSIICLMQKPPSEHFSNLAFLSITDFVLTGKNNVWNSNWLSRIFYSVFDGSQLKISTILRSTISYLPFISNNLNSVKIFQNNYWTLVFWSCWELVQSCIEKRLKTPLGKPQDTFTKIESAIKMFITEITTVGGNNKIELNIQTTVMRIHMLLMIMENFDKLIYNAIMGNSLRLYTSSKLSKTFFKKNKATCYEWINRNRRSIMILALKLGEPASVVRHGEELLRAYMKDKSLFTLDEIEFILLLMIDALIHLQAQEAVAGYYIWAKLTLNVKFNWIKAATDEANSRYENALESYQTLLKNKLDINSIKQNDNGGNASLNLVTSNKNFICNDYTVNFFHKRILNCYLNLDNYEEAVSWANSSQSSSINNLFNSKVNLDYLQSLSEFSDIELEADSKSTNTWGNLNTISWDMESIFHSLQSQLYGSTYKFYNSSCDESNKIFIEELDDLLKKKLNPFINSFNNCGLSAQNMRISNLQKVSYHLKKILSNKTNESALTGHGCVYSVDSNLDLLVNSLLWHKVYYKLNCKGQYVDTSEMKRSLDDLLLKTVTKARKSQNFNLSQNYLLQFAKSTIDVNVDDSGAKSKDVLLNIFQDSLSKPFSPNLVKFFMEISKLFYSFGESDLAIDCLLKSINVFVGENIISPEMSEPASRLFLKLVHYLQLDPNRCEKANLAKLNAFEKFNSVDENVICIKQLNQSENIIGKLLLFGVKTCPSLAKAWYRLADWSYKLGRKLSDIDEDKNDTEQITVGKKENIVDFYKLAAKSYIKFLHISTHSGCDDVNATLRLLRLILKHAPELREVLEAGLKQTPTRPWKNITLQLFSRLNHHELYVRQSISDLLCRIGSDSPHLVIFPAVAGSLDDQVKSENFDYTSTPNVDDEEDEEDNSQGVDSSIIQNCYASLLDTLGQQNPNLISQTKLFVFELRRITVLWDELWIGTLMHNLNEVRKQVALLEKEIEKTKLNSNLYDNEKLVFIKEQHNIFFRRILYSLKLTKLITSDAPETPHEEWFQRNFSELIDELIESISNPENLFEPANILYLYQNLLQTIRKRSLVTNKHYLQMQDISPKLSQLGDTVIPLPGLNASSTLSTVSLKKVFKTVSVLHTYTKPKKIMFIGSDGRNYTYLFKGHEDLHLDERIMQFLSIVNKMIVKYDAGLVRNSKLFCRARHYSVTPLGNKSGLIQWVEGGQALYNFYKKWLSNREVSIDDINKKVTAVDIFKNKLAEKGIVSENRNEWNLASLMEIYNELQDETPNDLIHKEIWCSSVNASNYWILTQNFITSNAIMSMIGYILGLGDRHLDNILLDLTTGEVIHIDYNVCFEKGKSLRVPERVLCRLTQNIVHAFGITGIEGTFRISCEHIMKILRKGKETLLTLLEAFVYDPLIDWTPEHEEGYTGAIYGGARVAQLAKEGKIIPKKQMEKENQEAIARLNQLIKSIEQRNSDWPKINNEQDLLQCGELLTTKKVSFGTKTVADQGGDTASSTKDVPSTMQSKKNKRNAYAFSVWKKIKMKFDGRDPDINKRLSVFDQVNYVLKESMDVENLARMYEGWTSWM